MLRAGSRLIEYLKTAIVLYCAFPPLIVKDQVILHTIITCKITFTLLNLHILPKKLFMVTFEWSVSHESSKHVHQNAAARAVQM